MRIQLLLLLLSIPWILSQNAIDPNDPSVVTPDPNANPNANPPDPNANPPDPNAVTPDPNANPPDPNAVTPDPNANPPDPNAVTPDPNANPPPVVPPPGPPPPPPLDKLEAVKVDNSEPVSRLYGSYAVKPAHHGVSRPGWASIWAVNDLEPHFGVYFWPPKYCHAIYICPVAHKTYGQSVAQRFDEFKCDTMYLKYYPHVRKIFFKANESSSEEVAFHVDPFLQFQTWHRDFRIFTMRALRKEPIDHEDWLAMKKSRDKKHFVDLDFNLKNMDLLILTNSRMCEINKPESEFFPIFDQRQEDNNDGKDTWPMWLNDGSNIVPTVNLPSTGESKKTIDLLDYLKTLTPAADSKLGPIDQYCGNFVKMGVQGDRKPVYEHSIHVSVASYDIYQPSMQPGGPWGLWLQFTMSNCQWIRFWATDKPISEYSKEMKVEDTLDLFLQEGFFIPPDSDIPVELPDIQIMDKMQLTIIRKPDGSPGEPDDHELIEFAFGEAGEGFLFRQFFKSTSFGKKDFKLHMIRSPFCEGNIITDRNPFSDTSVSGSLANLKDVQSCSYSYLIDKSAKKQ